MRCTSPRTVGFLSDGKTISWSSKNFSKQFATFQLPCGKCIECRLDYARQWAVRCVHESKMYDDNSFITLTYSDENLGDPKLNYLDFQLFIKRLRDQRFRTFISQFGKQNWKLLNKQERKKYYEQISISYFVTGEYGEHTKRKHWHAIIFNWRPTDCVYGYSNTRGDKVYHSENLQSLWGHGRTELGSVTFESAGYCARYAAKKLVHGQDNEHDFKPISKKSSKHAIGKRWLETYYRDVFTSGKIILHDGSSASIPRYYEKWFKRVHPSEYRNFITQKKLEITERSRLKSERIKLDELSQNLARLDSKGYSATAVITKDKTREIIAKQKHKMLQDHLKL